MPRPLWLESHDPTTHEGIGLLRTRHALNSLWSICQPEQPTTHTHRTRSEHYYLVQGALSLEEPGEGGFDRRGRVRVSGDVVEVVVEVVFVDVDAVGA
jgi:hypothetical protein